MHPGFLPPGHLPQNEFFSFLVRTLKKTRGELCHVTLVSENASRCSDVTSEDGLGCGVASAHRHLSKALETVTCYPQDRHSGNRERDLVLGTSLC